MKKALLAVLLVLAPSLAPALPNATTRTEKCVPLVISSSSPTEVTTNTAAGNVGSLVWSIKVTNTDTSNDIWCSHDPAVAISGTTNLGEVIVHRSAGTQPNWLAWWIGPNQLWYCLAQTASVTATVCRSQ